MKNKKMLSVLLSAAISASAVPFAVTAETTVSVLPQNTAKNVSVIDDIVLTGVTDATNITVEGTSVPYSIVKTESGSKIIFEDALEYASEITVKNGDEVLTQFTTQENPITLLYEQDFDDISVNRKYDSKNQVWLNGQKFGGLTVDHVQGPPTENGQYRTENGKLYMGLFWSSVGADKDSHHLRFVIDGSENWTDYEISADFMQNVPDAEKWVHGGFGLGYNGENTNNSAKVYVNWYEVPTNSNYSQLSRAYSDANGTWDRSTNNQNKCSFIDGEWYRLTTGVEGTTVKSKIEKDGQLLTSATDTGKNLNTNGSVYLAAFWYACWVDNIKAIDKGLIFTPSALKNVGDELKLTFSDPITSADTISINDGNSVLDISKTLSEDAKVVTLDTSSLESSKEYTVIVSKDTTATDGTVIANEKSFNFKTDNGFRVTQTNLKDDFDVVDDVELIFNTEVNETTIKDISVSGNNLPEYKVTVKGQKVSVEFAKQLPYDTLVNVTVPNTVSDINGIALSVNKTYSFKTSKNPITTLFFEDFESTAALDRFENVGVNKLNLYEIYDGKLLMKTHATRKADGGTPRLTTSKDNDILYIKGSENWDEYVVDIDVANGWYTKANETGEYTDSEAMISVNTNKNNGNGMLLLQCYDANWRACWSYHLSDWVRGNLLNAEVYFDTNYKTVHHMTIDASKSDYTASLTNDIDGTKTYKVGGGNQTYPSGGVSLRSSWGRIVYDNLLVTDKKLVFTTSDLKNVEDEVTLTFEKAVSSTDKITVSDENGISVNVPKSLSADGKVVTLNTAKLEGLKKYTVTVASDFAAADGTVIANEKKFNFSKTPTFISETNVKNNFRIIDDIEITFTDAINQETAQSITVTGNNLPAYDVITSEKGAKVVFAEGLPYNTEITLTIPAALQRADGIVMGKEQTYTFKTEHNPITTLFFEDFESTDALDRFENVGATPLNLYEIYDGKLLMKTHATRKADGGTPRLTKSKDNDILYIKGSENWDEYVVDIDVANGWYTKADETGEYTDSEAMISVNTNKNDGSGMLLFQCYDANWRPFYSYHLKDWVQGDLLNGENLFNTNYKTVHHIKIDASTTDYTASLTNDLGETLTHKVGWGNGAHPSGGVTLRSGWGRIVYDNLLVTDKGLTFGVEQSKYTDGEIKLVFDEALTNSEAELQNLVTVKNQNGETKELRVEYGQNQQSVLIEVLNAAEGEIYEITVDKAAKSAAFAKGMNNSKSFNLIYNPPYSIRNLAINEKDGQFVASAEINVTDKNIENQFTLILVVYDSKGKMVDFKTDAKIYNENTVNTFETQGIAKEAGYTASAFVWDNINDMTPLSGKVTK